MKPFCSREIAIGVTYFLLLCYAPFCDIIFCEAREIEGFMS